MKKMNREQYLERSIEALRPLFREIGHEIPKVRISVGWPGGGSKQTRIGEFWCGSAASDGVGQIFISPKVQDTLDVLAITVHEIIHGVVGTKAGHRSPFRKVALAVGLEGKMTSTHAGEPLKARLAKIAKKLGDYPHAALALGGSGRKQQTNRQLKLVCKRADFGCEAIVRMSRGNAEEYGVAEHCGLSMVWE